MGVLLKFFLVIYIISLLFSLFVALIHFVIDVFRWHDREESVHITPSQFEADLAAEDDTQSEEVINDDSECGEHNTPIIF